MIFIAGNVPSSKNSKRWTGKMLINSKTVMKYIKDTDMQYKTFKTDFKNCLLSFLLSLLEEQDIDLIM